MRASLRSALLCAALSASARAAQAADEGAGTSPEPAAWSVSASAYGFFVPESRSYLNPNVAADRGGLHLEARYNYEALETGSAWVGWTFAFGDGDALALEVTPMLGGAFGSVYGIAPGYLLFLGYRQVALSSQTEYLFDSGGRAGDFLYTWSELSWSPAEWFRTGLAVQRTRAYASSLDVQRGFLAGFRWRGVELATYVFNPGWTTPTVVVAVAAGGG
jgi:hypothetical protein